VFFVTDITRAPIPNLPIALGDRWGPKWSDFHRCSLDTLCSCPFHSQHQPTPSLRQRL